MRTVAIVVPARNEERYIAKCIDSVLAQDYPKELIDLYICDGKSSDHTASVVNAYSQKYPNVHLLINERQSTPFGLNMGIRASSADVVIILGAHAELYPSYVSNCLKAFDGDPRIGCTGGIIENIYENETAEVIGMGMSSSFGVGNAHFRTGNKSGFVDTVAFGAYKREVFAKIGYFDEELIRNQDDEFNYRLTRAGYLIFLSKDIRSKYYVRASFEKLFRQYYQYGYWKVYVGRKHGAVSTFRQLIPMLFVLFLVAGAFLSPLHTYVFRAYMGTIVLYLASAVYFAARKSEKAGQVPEIVFTFMILHFSYGSGYLRGIFDFLILKRSIKKEEALTR
jgi:cellulose synthase/poly-beta-1,6-N-acetylglucosamine synthase-like glycosyltransferase